MNHENRSFNISKVFFSCLLAFTALTLSACGGGGSGGGTSGGDGNGGNNNNAAGDFDENTATLRLVCPSPVPSNTTNTGFTVTLQDADGDSPAPPGRFIALTPTQGRITGTTNPGGGNSGPNGQLNFTFQAPNAGANLVVTITAEAQDLNGNVITGTTCRVTVQPDTFNITQPTDGSRVNPRTRFGRPMSLQWTRNRVGINGETVTLTGSGSTAFRVDGSTPANPVLVNIANGSFLENVTYLSTDQGPATITATANDGSGQTDTVNLTFTGLPTNIQFSANPAVIQRGNPSNLTATVRDSDGNPIAETVVTFRIAACQGNIVPPCGNNERVSPEVVRTNNDGVATAIYFSSAANPSGAAELTVFSEDDPSVSSNVAITVTP